MPRDYAKTPKPKEKRSLPGWAWLLGGLAIGLFIAMLVYIDKVTPSSDKNSITETIKQHWQDARDVRKQHQAQPPSKPPTNKLTHKPKFDFYTILPDMEVPIPEQDLVPGHDKNSKQKAIEDTTEYYLQAGSFKSDDEADKLKARLALQGIVATVQTVRIGDGDTWHRVRVGPLKGLSNLNQTRHRLQKMGVATIVVKNKS